MGKIADELPPEEIAALESMLPGADEDVLEEDSSGEKVPKVHRGSNTKHLPESEVAALASILERVEDSETTGGPGIINHTHTGPAESEEDEASLSLDVKDENPSPPDTPFLDAILSGEDPDEVIGRLIATEADQEITDASDEDRDS